jgi:hypothetical protein
VVIRLLDCSFIEPISAVIQNSDQEVCDQKWFEPMWLHPSYPDRKNGDYHGIPSIATFL